MGHQAQVCFNPLRQRLDFRALAGRELALVLGVVLPPSSLRWCLAWGLPAERRLLECTTAVAAVPLSSVFAAPRLLWRQHHVEPQSMAHRTRAIDCVNRCPEE